MNGSLNGVKVLDTTQVTLGPWASQMLGDMGADVIKSEPSSAEVIIQIGPVRRCSPSGRSGHTNDILEKLRINAHEFNILLNSGPAARGQHTKQHSSPKLKPLRASPFWLEKH